MQESLKKDKVNPRDLKMKLAREITKINHGEAAALKAQENFINTIQKKELPAEIKTWSAQRDKYGLLDLLMATGLALSKSEARRLVEQGAIKISEAQTTKVIRDAKTEIAVKSGIILQRGKLQFIKIIR
jgi:tyrosyl-tRNA synthetase